MKPLKRLLLPITLLLLFCVVLTSCALLEIETAGTATEPTPTENGGQTEMTTDRQTEPVAETTAETTTETTAATTTPPPEPSDYEYPMDQVTKLGGTIRSQQNDFMLHSKYSGATIDLADIPYDTVTVTKRSSAPEMGYTFLAALPVSNGEKPAYATGYSRVIWDERETATLAIPADAKYLYVYDYDNGVRYLPESIVFSNTPIPASFTVASWNIGHFSMGKHKTSDFPDDAYDTEKPKYLSYVYDSLGADVLCLNEYSELFTPSHPARELFLDYAAPFEGEQRNYSCNALYAKFPLKNLTVHEFDCNTPDTVLHTTAIKATDYYYITAELPVGDETVTIIALHLAFHDNLRPDTVCTNQMDELIAKYADAEHVVLLGDWNAYHAEYYERFAEAGYTVANDGSYLTCTGSATGGLEWPVDNIIVKGLTISDFRAVDTSLSDHVAVIATITVD